MAKPIVSVTIKSKLQAIEKLALAKTAVRLGANQGIVRAGLFLQGEVKQDIAGRKGSPRITSVDTGRLLNSVDLLLKRFEAVIFSNVPYAKNIEFNPDIKKGPRRPFNRSLARNRTKIREIVQANIFNR